MVSIHHVVKIRTITGGISDHVSSFLIIPGPNQNHIPKKHNIYTRDRKNIDRENFLFDILSIDWGEI